MIDSHTHLEDSRYQSERQDIIDNLAIHGIDFVINNSSDYDSMMLGYQLATNNDRVYCTVGMHPHDAKSYDDAFARQQIELAANNKVVAVGEIGLDYYYDFSDRQTQRDVFARQIELADKLHLPIVLHVRDAYGDTADILKAQHQYLNNGVLWHCYSGSAEYAKTYVRQGHYFAFGGAITFRNANKQDVIDTIPATQVLTETDCPYMTPVPLRGKTNYPHYVKYVLDKLASMYNMPIQQLEQQILCNCKALFGRIR